jgi:hypothetical protein
MSRSIGIVFAFGPGDLALQALYLARSIRNYTKHDEVVAFTTEEEFSRIPRKIRAELKQTCRIEVGTEPVGSFPISIKLAALDRAASILDTEYLLCLDADTLVLDEVTVPKPESELYLKPVDIGGQYYGTRDSHNEWKSLAETFGFTFPGITTRSTVDKKHIPPYWNAGMVLTKNNDFPGRWLSLMKSLHKSYDTGYFTDQVALGLLSTEYDVSEVGEAYNYPLTHRLSVPGSVNIIHYNTFFQLARIYYPRVLSRVAQTGIFESIDRDRQTFKHLGRNVLETGRRRINHILEH